MTDVETITIFDQIVHDRRSCRMFDADLPFDDSAVERSLQRAILAPNSSNLQLWEFYRVKSEDVKSAMAANCFGQPAAATAREMVVFVTRKDLWESRKNWLVEEIKTGFDDLESKEAKGTMKYYNTLIPMLYRSSIPVLKDLFMKLMTFIRGISKVTPREVTQTDMRIVVHKSCALAAQTFMLSMKAEGYDSCPMEGFDSKRAKQLLDLAPDAEINMIIGVGPGVPEGIYGERIRLPYDEVVFER